MFWFRHLDGFNTQWTEDENGVVLFHTSAWSRWPGWGSSGRLSPPQDIPSASSLEMGINKRLPAGLKLTRRRKKSFPCSGLTGQSFDGVDQVDVVLRDQRDGHAVPPCRGRRRRRAWAPERVQDPREVTVQTRASSRQPFSLKAVHYAVSLMNRDASCSTENVFGSNTFSYFLDSSSFWWSSSGFVCFLSVVSFYLSVWLVGGKWD